MPRFLRVPRILRAPRFLRVPRFLRTPRFLILLLSAVVVLTNGHDARQRPLIQKTDNFWPLAPPLLVLGEGVGG